jgi:hypothetical protein
MGVQIAAEVSRFTLFDFKGGAIRAVRAVPDSELLPYRQAVLHLHEFHRARKLIQIVERNGAELEAEFRSARQRLEASQTLTAAREETELEVNRRLLNYLTAMRLFLDQTEARLKRRYGADSPEVQAFLDRCKAAYDGAFGYRFFYKLRNFGQHQALPIGHVKVSSAFDPATGKTSKSVEVSFDTRELLEQGKNTWGTVEDELKSGPQLLDVQALVQEASVELRGIEATIMTAEKGALTKSAETIRGTLQEVLTAGGIPAVARLTEQLPKANLEVILAPREAFHWLGFQDLAIEI